MSKSMRVLVTILAVFVSLWVRSKEIPQLEGGRIEGSPMDFQSPIPEPFRYDPLEQNFWKRVADRIEQQDFASALELGVERWGEERPKGETLAFGEGQLAVAMALRYLGFPATALQLSIDLARKQIGSRVGEAALSEINEIIQEHDYDDLEIEDLLSAGEFGEVHPHIQSMISYFRGMQQLRLGFSEWSEKEFSRVRNDSFWAFQRKYLTALGEVARGRSEAATALFEDLSAGDVPFKIVNLSKLQRARLLFEKGEFQNSYELYKGLVLPLREKGRVVLEMAWSQYYLKNYSEALGLIESFKSPYFEASLSSEAYLLEMVIYKELCHYRKVNLVASEFRSRFQSSMEQIDRRLDLSLNSIILRSALKHMQYQPLANYVHQIRDERRRWKFSEPILTGLRDRMNGKELEVVKRVKFVASEQVQLVAEDILDSLEQVMFTEYVASLDQLRVSRANRSLLAYNSEDVPHLSFNKTFWPINGEHWWDEIESYRVLTESRCQ